MSFDTALVWLLAAPFELMAMQRPRIPPRPFCVDGIITQNTRNVIRVYARLALIVKPVCGWWDSNPHGLAPRTLRVFCVYRSATPAPCMTLGDSGMSTQARNARRPWHRRISWDMDTSVIGLLRDVCEETREQGNRGTSLL